MVTSIGPASPLPDAPAADAPASDDPIAEGAVAPTLSGGGRGMMRSSAIYSGLTLVSRFLGFGRDLVVAEVMGASSGVAAAAWNTANGRCSAKIASTRLRSRTSAMTGTI